jgi:hypothetical protein
MVRSKSLAAIALSAALLGAFYGCAPEDFHIPASQPSPLINDIPSMSSPRDVRERADLRDLEWRIVEGADRRSNAKFAETVVIVSGYTANGLKGDLRLAFVNDRLLSTWFYPENVEDFLKALAESGVSFKPDAAGSKSFPMPDSNTVLRVGSDHTNRRYVAWEDEVFQSAVDSWISRNS